MHRVYAGINKQSELKVKRFLKSINDLNNAKLCKLSNITEVETCKIIENTYRAMNIAFIEEWRNFSSLNDLNLNKILNFIRFRKTHNNIMRPGIGVGGYCLTKDPLMVKLHQKNFKKLVKLPISQNIVRINQRMPKEVLSDIEKRLQFKIKRKCIFIWCFL